MPSPTEEDDEYWTEQWQQYDRTVLERVSAYAQRWHALLIGLVAAYAGLGFVWAPELAAHLPDDASARAVIVAAFVAVAILGGAGIAVLTGAAGGSADTTQFAGPDDYRQRRIDEANTIATDVTTSKRLTGIAAIVLAVATLAVALNAATSESARVRIVVDDGSAIRCGELAEVDGRATLAIADAPSPAPILSGSRITIVESCGDR